MALSVGVSVDVCDGVTVCVLVNVTVALLVWEGIGLAKVVGEMIWIASNVGVINGMHELISKTRQAVKIVAGNLLSIFSPIIKFEELCILGPGNRDRD